MCLRLGDSSKVTWLSQTTRTPAWIYCIPGTTACLRRLPGSQESWTEGDMRKGDLNSSIPRCQETKTVRLFNPSILQVRHAKPRAPGLNLSDPMGGRGFGQFFCSSSPASAHSYSFMALEIQALGRASVGQPLYLGTGHHCSSPLRGPDY